MTEYKVRKLIGAGYYRVYSNILPTDIYLYVSEVYLVGERWIEDIEVDVRLGRIKVWRRKNFNG